MGHEFFSILMLVTNYHVLQWWLAGLREPLLIVTSSASAESDRQVFASKPKAARPKAFENRWVSSKSQRSELKAEDSNRSIELDVLGAEDLGREVNPVPSRVR